MNEKYKEYIIQKWKEAEDLALKIGSANNTVIVSFFDKIAQPEYYWLKNK